MVPQDDEERLMAQRIRREVRTGGAVGAVWFELYRVDRDAAIPGLACTKSPSQDFVMDYKAFAP